MGAEIKVPPYQVSPALKSIYLAKNMWQHYIVLSNFAACNSNGSRILTSNLPYPVLSETEILSRGITLKLYLMFVIGIQHKDGSPNTSIDLLGAIDFLTEIGIQRFQAPM